MHALTSCAACTERNKKTGCDKGATAYGFNVTRGGVHTACYLQLSCANNAQSAARTQAQPAGYVSAQGTAEHTV